MMLTTDLALRMDPIYEPISRRFHENPDEFADAFAKAWYKLLHRDMGPRSRCLGSMVPAEPQLWQDPVPDVNHELIDEQDIAAIEGQRSSTQGCQFPSWSRPHGRRRRAFAALTSAVGQTGHACVSRRRRIGKSTIRPNWRKSCRPSTRSRTGFNGSQSGAKLVSLADLIVLGGCAAVEQAAKNGGHNVQVPFSPGRTDALQEQTDVESFAVLEPTADGFRNYIANGHKRPAEDLLVDRASLLTLTAPEMTVLVGGMRALNANTAQSELGVLTERPEALTRDFFVNLLDMSIEWKASSTSDPVFEGHDRGTGEQKWTATAVDLVFGSNSQLRAIAEVYACDDSEENFVRDFVAAWDKVMNLDRFDLD